VRGEEKRINALLFSTFSPEKDLMVLIDRKISSSQVKLKLKANPINVQTIFIFTNTPGFIILITILSTL
jgi:hypothetical protein